MSFCFIPSELSGNMSRMEQYHPGISNVCLSDKEEEMGVLKHHFILDLIRHQPCVWVCFSGGLQVKAHEVRKIVTSMLFSRNCSPASIEDWSLVIPEHLFNHLSSAF